MKNKIADLRDHIFATIEAVRDKENPMPIDRAYAIAELASVLIESAKVEVAQLRVLAEFGAPIIGTTGFIPVETKAETQQAQDGRQVQWERPRRPGSEHPWRRS